MASAGGGPPTTLGEDTISLFLQGRTIKPKSEPPGKAQDRAAGALERHPPPTPVPGVTQREFPGPRTSDQRT